MPYQSVSTKVDTYQSGSSKGVSTKVDGHQSGDRSAQG